MTQHQSLDLPLRSSGFLGLLGAQFFSALADNALLVALMGILVSRNSPASETSLLQELFVIPFLLLAPLAGPLADGMSKNRAMLFANGIKMVGAAGVVFGLSPFISYGIVGIGACLYSPAKYGILPELCAPDKLVKANSALEGSTIAAILLGVLLGGKIGQNAPQLAVEACLLAYIVAMGLNLLIPKTMPKTQGIPSASILLTDFWSALRDFFKDSKCRASLLGTSFFLGRRSEPSACAFCLGSLRFGASPGPDKPAELMGILSVGIVVGAVAASKWGSIQAISRSLVSGLLIGPVIVAMALCHSFLTAGAFLFVTGVLGGFFVIPLNALIQEVGHETHGAGRALAVQNFVENGCMLAFASFYGFISSKMDPAASSVALGFALFIACMLNFAAYSSKRKTI